MENTKFHVALNTLAKRFGASVDFYAKLFGVAPVKLTNGYAKFDVIDPPINLTLNAARSVSLGELDHLGIQAWSEDTVRAARRRLKNAGIATGLEHDTHCCHADQHKFWLSDPDGRSIEFFFTRSGWFAPRREPATNQTSQGGWVAIVEQLGPTFTERAAANDREMTFVAANYADLRRAKAFSAGIPGALGGGDASYDELCDMVRRLAHYCGSTALAFSMHAHTVAVLVRRWKDGDATGLPLLRRVVNEQSALATTGGTDWLSSSGNMTAVSEGFEVTARKPFVSGAPGASVLLTSAVFQDAHAPVVLHFPVELSAPGVTISNNWKTLGMRGTGSNDVVLDKVFVGRDQITLRRTPGIWHPLLHFSYVHAMPIVLSAYVGLAQAARGLAVEEARRKRSGVDLKPMLGRLDAHLRAAEITLASAVSFAQSFEPGPSATREMLLRKQLISKEVLALMGKAIDVMGGAAYFCDKGLERLARDAQAVRFHPLQEAALFEYCGAHALDEPSGVEPTRHGGSVRPAESMTDQRGYSERGAS